MLCIIASEIVLVQFPHLLGAFTDALEAGRLTAGGVGRFALELLAVGVLNVVLYGIGQYRNGRLSRDFEYQLRRRLFAHWEQLSTAYFRHRSIGDLLNHAMTDVQAVREALGGGVNILTNAVFLLLSTLVMTFRTVSVKLTLVSMIPIAFIPVFVVWLGPRVRQASRRVQEALSDMADLAEESLTAIRLVKASGSEPVEERRFTERVNEIVRRQVGLYRRSALFQSTIPLMSSLSFFVALLYGGTLAMRHQIPLGAFVAFTLYLTMLTTPLQQIGFVINNFQRASASLARLSALLAEVPEIQDPPHPVVLERVRGEIEIDLPSYTYPDGAVPVLEDIHLHVRAGQTVGIVGRTGAGKTTLVSLLPRVFDPPPGTVRIDGIDVRDLSLATLRGAIAYVPQDGFLFSASIADNLRFGRADATMPALERAAEDAAVLGDIRRFPEGMDTIVGERGVTLSGGQRQRLAIARALLKDAPILVLDDSLSAVDMNTEKRIIARLRELRQGKTTLIIAHRLSAVRHADVIIVLERGRVVERGTHEELVAAGGLYAEMYARQQTGEGEVAG
ncbi:MAG: ABC transporter ATP-binding protein [Thermoflavifilum sp.]|nr:ABC transporter ATP-binding protein [Thermoflavifilum sp.]MCL6512949.1 ABC transporter ATP-binding protein/permease [Alicyclobacillus sp.]